MARGRVYNRIYTKEEWKGVKDENKAIMEDFLMEMKQQKKKEGTIKQYMNDLRIIFIYIKRKLENKNILECSKKDFRKISLWFTDELQLSNARANRLLSATRSMLDFCEQDDDDYEEYDNNIAKKVKGLQKEEVRDIHFLSDEQVLKLYEKLIEQQEYQKATLLMMAYDSVGRRNELFQVKKAELIDRNYTNIVVGKRGKKFPLIYFSKTVQALRLYLAQRGKDDIESLWIIEQKGIKRPATYQTLYHWFVYMANLLSEMEDKEIPFNPHSLRHSGLENLKKGTHYYCRELNRDGFTINELKVHAHHSDISTTDSYCKNDDSEILSNMFGIKIE